MKMIFAIALAVIGLGLGLRGSPAFADVTYFPPVTTFEDDDLDFFINNTGGTTTIDEGDVLIGVVEFNTSAGVFGGGPAGFGGDELTAIFAIEVKDKIDNGDGTFDFVFGPVGSTTGTMVAVFLDDSPDLTVVPPNCINLADCLAKAGDGDPYLELGFNGDANEAWVALNALDDTDVVDGLPAASKVGTLNFFLNILVNNTGQTFAPQACTPLCPAGEDGAVDLIGSGDILGGQGLSNGAFARSDSDVQLATVPEPSTLLLLGAGLLGLGSFARRRIKK